MLSIFTYLIDGRREFAVTEMYEVLAYNSTELSKHIDALGSYFKINACHSFEQLIELTKQNEYHFILIDVIESDAEGIATLKKIKNGSQASLSGIPVVLFIEKINLDTQLTVYEIGVDDCISTQEPIESIVSRLQSTIFNAIANKQLKGQLKAATDVAMTAMSNTSDLGCNIQFLLDSHECENVDQLGQLLFQSLNHYGLTCSLQMRGRFCIKNMEANGMARAMESQLLGELKDKERFYDFGCRTVINYGGVSLLIKDMPIEDEVKYGMIKDNVFALLQGVEARINALDTQTSLFKEREMQEDLLVKMQCEVSELGGKYKVLSESIASVVDQMANTIESSIMTLLLTEEQEQVLKEHLEQGRNSVCDLFEENASMDEGLRAIIERVALTHESKGKPEYEQLVMAGLKKQFRA